MNMYCYMYLSISYLSNTAPAKWPPPHIRIAHFICSGMSLTRDINSDWFWVRTLQIGNQCKSDMPHESIEKKWWTEDRSSQIYYWYLNILISISKLLTHITKVRRLSSCKLLSLLPGMIWTLFFHNINNIK